MTLIPVESPARGLLVAVENCSVVFQGAVGAFCASTVPAASIGALRLSTNHVVPFVEPCQRGPTEMNRPDAVGHLLEADGVAMNSNRFLNRNVPALVMRFTMKWPGYTMGGSVPV